MKKILNFIVLSAFFFGNICLAQLAKFEQNEAAVTWRIKNDITVLASDSFMGRETGTAGEIMARDYIISQYKAIGIPPYFSEASYTQEFTFKDSPSPGDSNFFTIDGKPFVLSEDYYPLSFSASGYITAQVVYANYGISLPASGYNDYKNKSGLKGKIFVIETVLPEEHKTDTNFIKQADMQKKVDTAIAYGAAGIIFINSDIHANNPPEKLTSLIIPSSIPVIFVKEKALGWIFSKKNTNLTEISVNIERKTKTGYNVASYIDNKAATTIIIGAHYDHIGMGSENSRSTDTVPLIHNGADDNASGTAAVIELARYFMNTNKKNHNYLFIHFSGEEKGLYGSSFFTKSFFFDTSKTAYMLNIDMAGRYDTSKVGLDIEGTGTSTLWDTLIAASLEKELKVKKTISGFGGSDHMSFYLRNIPVLSLTTGIHSDYHMPSDDAEKINFNGEAEIVKFAERLIENTNTIKKIPFIKTKNDSNTRQTKFSVTLGIVPDHSFDGKGLRIEGTSPGKPAEKAGLKGGDIIMKIGDYDVSEIMSYMKALGYFKKGDKTKVIVKRGEETLTIDVEF
ncbi:MAG: M28 family peptidase [Bacteroidota bacterium]